MAADDQVALTRLVYDAGGARQGATEFQNASQLILAENRRVEEALARTSATLSGLQSKMAAAHRATTLAASESGRAQIEAAARASDTIGRTHDQAIAGLRERQQTLARSASLADPFSASRIGSRSFSEVAPAESFEQRAAGLAEGMRGLPSLREIPATGPATAALTPAAISTITAAGLSSVHPGDQGLHNIVRSTAIAESTDQTVKQALAFTHATEPYVQNVHAANVGAALPIAEGQALAGATAGLASEVAKLRVMPAPVQSVAHAGAVAAGQTGAIAPTWAVVREPSGLGPPTEALIAALNRLAGRVDELRERFPAQVGTVHPPVAPAATPVAVRTGAAGVAGATSTAETEVGAIGGAAALLKMHGAAEIATAGQKGLAAGMAGTQVAATGLWGSLKGLFNTARSGAADIGATSAAAQGLAGATGAAAGVAHEGVGAAERLGTAIRGHAEAAHSAKGSLREYRDSINLSAAAERGALEPIELLRFGLIGLAREFGAPGIATALVGGAAFAGIAVLLNRAEELERQTRSFAATIKTMGTGSEVSAKQLDVLAEELKHTGVSAEDAKKSVDAVARSQFIAPDAYKEFLLTARNAAAQTHAPAPETANKMVEAFAAGVPSALKFTESLVRVSAEEDKNIRFMDQHDGAGKALAATYALLAARLVNYKELLTPVELATQELKNHFDDLLKTLAESNWVNSLLRGLTKYIDLLNETAGKLDHFKENFKWFLEHGADIPQSAKPLGPQAKPVITIPGLSRRSHGEDAGYFARRYGNAGDVFGGPLTTVTPSPPTPPPVDPLINDPFLGADAAGSKIAAHIKSAIPSTQDALRTVGESTSATKDLAGKVSALTEKIGTLVPGTNLEIGGALAAPPAAPLSAQGAEAQRQIGNYAVGTLGFTPSQSAALIGQARQESSFRPDAGLGTAHQGMFQLDAERWGQFQAWAQLNGLNPLDYRTQLQFAKQEIQIRAPEFFAATSLPEQTAILTRKFEVPGNYGVEVPRRLGFAEQALAATTQAGVGFGTRQQREGAAAGEAMFREQRAAVANQIGPQSQQNIDIQKRIDLRNQEGVERERLARRQQLEVEAREKIPGSLTSDIERRQFVAEGMVGVEKEIDAAAALKHVIDEREIGDLARITKAYQQTEVAGLQAVALIAAENQVREHGGSVSAVYADNLGKSAGAALKAGQEQLQAAQPQIAAQERLAQAALRGRDAERLARIENEAVTQTFNVLAKAQADYAVSQTPLTAKLLEYANAQHDAARADAERKETAAANLEIGHEVQGKQQESQVVGLQIRLQGTGSDEIQQQVAQLRLRQDLETKFAGASPEYKNAYSDITNSLILQNRELEESERHAHRLEEAFQSIASTISGELTDALRNALIRTPVEAGEHIAHYWREFRQGLKQTLASVETTFVNAALIKPLTGTIAGALGIGQTAQQLGTFATGGAATVGGGGGTDSTHVHLMATPGERVYVLTPAQQAAAHATGAMPHFAGGGEYDPTTGQTIYYNDAGQPFTLPDQQGPPIPPQQGGGPLQSLLDLSRKGLESEAAFLSTAAADQPIIGFDTNTAELTGRIPALADFMQQGLAGGAPAGTLSSGIKAFHGSPHDFDRFDIAKIGTGEGAQAYGHGLYFAEEESVARQYRDKLADKPEILVGGESQPLIASAFDQSNTADSIAANRIAAKWRALSSLGHAPEVNAISEEVRGELETGIQIAAERGDFPVFESLTNQKTSLDRMIDRGIEVKTKGKMYEVGIHADPESFLQWDKPLSEQSDGVKAALGYEGIVGAPSHEKVAAVIRDARAAGTPIKDYPPYQALQAQNEAAKQFTYDQLGIRNAAILPGDLTGSALHTGLVERFGDPTAATEHLRNRGIPGIRYLDQDSRTSGEGSHNIVMFGDENIEILRKYGLAGPPSLAQPGDQPAPQEPAAGGFSYDQPLPMLQQGGNVVGTGAETAQQLGTFATGGAATVGGGGGTDSTHVHLMATPGERVYVLTPAQQAVAHQSGAMPRFAGGGEYDPSTDTATYYYGDPEAYSAAQASTAMEPAVGSIAAVIKQEARAFGQAGVDLSRAGLESNAEFLSGKEAAGPLLGFRPDTGEFTGRLPALAEQLTMGLTGSIALPEQIHTVHQFEGLLERAHETEKTAGTASTALRFGRAVSGVRGLDEVAQGETQPGAGEIDLFATLGRLLPHFAGGGEYDPLTGEASYYGAGEVESRSARAARRGVEATLAGRDRSWNDIMTAVPASGFAMRNENLVVKPDGRIPYGFGYGANDPSLRYIANWENWLGYAKALPGAISTSVREAIHGPDSVEETGRRAYTDPLPVSNIGEFEMQGAAPRQTAAWISDPYAAPSDDSNTIIAQLPHFAGGGSLDAGSGEGTYYSADPSTPPGSYRSSGDVPTSALKSHLDVTARNTEDFGQSPISDPLLIKSVGTSEIEGRRGSPLAGYMPAASNEVGADSRTGNTKDLGQAFEGRPLIEKIPGAINIESRAVSASTRNVPVSTLKSGFDGGDRNAHEFGNSFVPNSFVIQDLGALNIESSTSAMQPMVGGTFNHFEIGKPVIGPVSVDVMHMLGGEQFSPQMLLHYPSVLKDQLFPDSNPPVPSVIQPINKITSVLALSGAEGFPGLHIPSVPDEMNATGGADESELHNAHAIPMARNIGNIQEPFNEGSHPEIPRLARGGTVEQTGVAIVHSGESVLSTAAADNALSSLTHGLQGLSTVIGQATPGLQTFSRAATEFGGLASIFKSGSELFSPAASPVARAIGTTADDAIRNSQIGITVNSIGSGGGLLSATAGGNVIGSGALVNVQGLANQAAVAGGGAVRANEGNAGLSAQQMQDLLNARETGPVATQSSVAPILETFVGTITSDVTQAAAAQAAATPATTTFIVPEALGGGTATGTATSLAPSLPPEVRAALPNGVTQQGAATPTTPAAAAAGLVTPSNIGGAVSGATALGSLLSQPGLLPSWLSGTSGGGGIFGVGGIGGAINSFGASTGLFASGGIGTGANALSGAELAGLGVPGASAGGILGTATLGSVLTGAGAGLGAGLLLNSALGGNQLGGTVGSAGGATAGAIIGSLFAPVIGTLIGGVVGGAAGGGLGGLFGAGPSGQSAGTVVNAQSGHQAFDDVGGSAANIAAANQVSGQISSFIAALGQLTDAQGRPIGNLNPGSIAVSSDNRRGIRVTSDAAGISGGSFDQNAANAVQQVELQIIQSLGNVSGSLKTILDHLTDPSQLQAAVQFADVYDRLNVTSAQLTASLNGNVDAVGPFSQALLSVNQTFSQLSGQARQFGVSTAPISAALDAVTKTLNQDFAINVAEGLSTAIDGGNDFLASLIKIHQQFVQNTSDAKALATGVPTGTIAAAASGSARTPAGQILVGERGPEWMLPAGGEWLQVGKNGPEILDQPGGAVILPHPLTPDRAFAQGTIGPVDIAGQVPSIGSAISEAAGGPSLLGAAGGALGISSDTLSTIGSVLPVAPIIGGIVGLATGGNPVSSGITIATSLAALALANPLIGVVGGLVALVSNLFGPKPSNRSSGDVVDLGSGAITGFQSSGDSNADSAVQQISLGISRITTAFQAATGGTLSGVVNVQDGRRDGIKTSYAGPLGKIDEKWGSVSDTIGQFGLAIAHNLQGIDPALQAQLAGINDPNALIPAIENFTQKAIDLNSGSATDPASAPPDASGPGAPAAAADAAAAPATAGAPAPDAAAPSAIVPTANSGWGSYELSVPAGWSGTVTTDAATAAVWSWLGARVSPLGSSSHAGLQDYTVSVSRPAQTAIGATTAETQQWLASGASVTPLSPPVPAVADAGTAQPPAGAPPPGHTFANGGTTPPGWILVGERGPEWMLQEGGATVLPNGVQPKDVPSLAGRSFANGTPDLNAALWDYGTGNPSPADAAVVNQAVAAGTAGDVGSLLSMAMSGDFGPWPPAPASPAVNTSPTVAPVPAAPEAAPAPASGATASGTIGSTPIGQIYQAIAGTEAAQAGPVLAGLGLDQLQVVISSLATVAPDIVGMAQALVSSGNALPDILTQGIQALTDPLDFAIAKEKALGQERVAVATQTGQDLVKVEQLNTSSIVNTIVGNLGNQSAINALTYPGNTKALETLQAAPALAQLSGAQLNAIVSSVWQVAPDLTALASGILQNNAALPDNITQELEGIVNPLQLALQQQAAQSAARNEIGQATGQDPNQVGALNTASVAQAVLQQISNPQALQALVYGHGNLQSLSALQGGQLLAGLGTDQLNAIISQIWQVAPQLSSMASGLLASGKALPDYLTQQVEAITESGVLGVQKAAATGYEQVITAQATGQDVGQARQLGTAEVSQAVAQATNTQIPIFGLPDFGTQLEEAVVNPLQLAVQKAQALGAQEVQIAQQTGADVIQVQRAASESVQQIWYQATSSLTDLKNQITGGTLSGLIPANQVSASVEQFNQLLALVQGGNTNFIGQLASAGQAAVQAAQSAYGNGPQTASVRQEILAAIQPFLVSASGYPTTGPTALGAAGFGSGGGSAGANSLTVAPPTGGTPGNTGNTPVGANATPTPTPAGFTPDLAASASGVQSQRDLITQLVEQQAPGAASAQAPAPITTQPAAAPAPHVNLTTNPVTGQPFTGPNGITAITPNFPVYPSASTLSNALADAIAGTGTPGDYTAINQGVQAGILNAAEQPQFADAITAAAQYAAGQAVNPSAPLSQALSDALNGTPTPTEWGTIITAVNAGLINPVSDPQYATVIQRARIVANAQAVSLSETPNRDTAYNTVYHGLPAFAAGSMATPPGMILVGEKGPEIIYQPGGLAVMPHGVMPDLVTMPAFADGTLPAPAFELPSQRSSDSALAPGNERLLRALLMQVQAGNKQAMDDAQEAHRIARGIRTGVAPGISAPARRAVG